MRAQPRLRAAGCTVDMLVRHYVWCTEYLYTHLHPRETAKTITLFDVKVQPSPPTHTIALTSLGAHRLAESRRGRPAHTWSRHVCQHDFLMFVCCVAWRAQGVGLRDLAGDAFDFLRKSASMIQEVRHPSHAALDGLGSAEAHFCLVLGSTTQSVPRSSSSSTRQGGSASCGK